MAEKQETKEEEEEEEKEEPVLIHGMSVDDIALTMHLVRMSKALEVQRKREINTLLASCEELLSIYQFIQEVEYSYPIHKLNDEKPVATVHRCFPNTPQRKMSPKELLSVFDEDDDDGGGGHSLHNK